MLSQDALAVAETLDDKRVAVADEPNHSTSGKSANAGHAANDWRDYRHESPIGHRAQPSRARRGALARLAGDDGPSKVVELSKVPSWVLDVDALYQLALSVREEARALSKREASS